MTELVKASGAIATVDAVRDALRSSLYPGASDASVDMVMAYCRAAGLDPMTKPVHIVPIWIPEKKERGRVVHEGHMRDVVMPGIELYRTKAHRTGEYAGQDEPEFGPTVESVLDGTIIRHPEWCRVTVYRIVANQRVPFPARAYWMETYATAKRDTSAPNAMWRKRPFGQLEKCAEALALRKAFPEAVGAQPTMEEMDGREFEQVHSLPAPRSEDSIAAEWRAKMTAAASLAEIAQQRDACAEAYGDIKRVPQTVREEFSRRKKELESRQEQESEEAPAKSGNVDQDEP